MSKKTFHKLFYMMKEFIAEPDQTLLQEGQKPATLIIVKNGLLEVLIDIDGFNFVLARLGRGSIMNCRNILLKNENMKVSLKCKERAQLIFLPINDLNKVAEHDKQLKSSILMFTNKIYKQCRGSILDYLPAPDTYIKFKNKNKGIFGS